MVQCFPYSVAQEAPARAEERSADCNELPPVTVSGRLHSSNDPPTTAALLHPATWGLNLARSVSPGSRYSAPKAGTIAKTALWSPARNRETKEPQRFKLD